MRKVHRNGLEIWLHYLELKSLGDLVPETEACDVGIMRKHFSAFVDINTLTRIAEYLALGNAAMTPRTLSIQDRSGPESLLFFEPDNSQELARQLNRSLFITEMLTRAPRAGNGSTWCAHGLRTDGTW